MKYILKILFIAITALNAMVEPEQGPGPNPHIVACFEQMRINDRSIHGTGFKFVYQLRDDYLDRGDGFQYANQRTIDEFEPHRTPEVSEVYIINTANESQAVLVIEDPNVPQHAVLQLLLVFQRGLVQMRTMFDDHYVDYPLQEIPLRGYPEFSVRKEYQSLILLANGEPVIELNADLPGKEMFDHATQYVFPEITEILTRYLIV